MGHTWRAHNMHTGTRIWSDRGRKRFLQTRRRGRKWKHRKFTEETGE